MILLALNYYIISNNPSLLVNRDEQPINKKYVDFLKEGIKKFETKSQ